MVCDECNCCFSFWAIFCPFTTLTAQKMKILKKKRKKKTPGDIIILRNCSTNHDHMLYCSWDMAHETCNYYFSFWAILCPFTRLTRQKNQNFKKMKKSSGDIIILHMSTLNYYYMMYARFLRYGARQTDRRTNR